MKVLTKRVTAGILAAMLVCNMVACSKNDDQAIKNTVATESSSTEFSVNQKVHDGHYISLSLLKIMPDGMLFEVKNKSDVVVSVILDIALDGIGVRLWGDSSDWEVPAGGTKQCKMNGSITELEHKLLSMKGIVFVDNRGAETFDICDLDIGGTAHSEELPVGEVLYSSEKLEVEYLEADAQGLQFKVANHRDVSITIGFEELSMNGNEGRCYNVSDIVPHSTGIYSVALSLYHKDYFPDDIKSFKGIFFTTINGRKTDRAKVSWGDTQVIETEEVTEATVPLALQENICLTEKAFLTATTLTKKDLHLTQTGRYEYQDFSMVNEDMEWLNDSLNKDGAVELGALYRSAAKILVGFEKLGKTLYGNWGESTVPVILGIKKPKTWDECKPYVENARQFITTEDSKNAVLRKLEQLSCVDGTFDFEKGIFDFTIADLTQAANEMGISETMLGYCFALLAEYGPAIEFSENSCTFKLEMWHS